MRVCFQIKMFELPHCEKPTRKLTPNCRVISNESKTYLGEDVDSPLRIVGARIVGLQGAKAF